MDPAGLDRIEQLFATGDSDGGQRALFELLSGVRPSASALASATAALVARLPSAAPPVAACFALGAGALVEQGVPPGALAAALLEPLIRALHAAHPFVELAASEPDDDDKGGALAVGDRMLSPASVKRLMTRNPLATGAFVSLETWYRPVVAAWTRETAELRRAQSSNALRAALDPLADACAGTYWVNLLLGTAVDMPLVVLFPETGDAYSVRLDGCADMGQTTVLFSEALAGPLRRIGASKSASKAMLAVMRGEEAPQQSNACYSATFRAYPWQAIDPDTGLPKDRRFTWVAPGGSGTHSLPMDFQPSALEPVDGVRVLALVGPKGPGMQFTREIGGARMFQALRATVDDVEKLKAPEARKWIEGVKAKCRAV